MWALILQLLAILVGWQVIRLLPVKWHRLEALASSVAVGFSISAWSHFVICGLIGFRIGLPLTTLLLLIISLATWGFIKPRAILTSAPYGRSWRWLAWLTAIGIALIITNLVYLSYQLPAASGAWYSNGNAWGDLPLHVGLVTQFSHGDKLDLISPVYKHVPLTYPLMADLWSGVLMRTTTNWWLGLMLPSLLMMLSLLQLVFSFGYRLLGSAWGAWLQFLMLVFSGSLRGGWILGKILLTQGWGAYNSAVGYSLAFATGDNYLNFIHSHPIPQRAFLFGMPLLLVILSVALTLYRGIQNEQLRRHARTTGIIAGVLGGLLPLVHTHSFMVLAGLLVLATAGFKLTKHPVPPGWWAMILVMTALAAPQIYWQFHSTYSSGFTRWIFGWMMENFQQTTNTNWLLFWLYNTGFLFVIILSGWFWLWRVRAKPEIWLCYLAGVSIFAISNVYVFQPSMWDNMKFFEYAFWMIMLTTAALMTRWAKHVVGKIFVAMLMVTLTVMGFFTLALSGPQLNFEILSASDVNFGEQMSRALPPDAYVLVGERHNHPITMLSNRKVLMTFSGWYNLYGSDWPTTLQDRGIMLTGGDSARQLIERYKLTYAVFSDDEINRNEANLSFYQQNFALFDHEANWWVFDLSRPPQ